MERELKERQERRAGFSMIGLLLVLVILFVLAGYYFTSPFERQKEAIGTYQYSTEKARNVVQGANLQVLQTSIDMWAMQHPGERCTIEKLQAEGRYTIPAPPAGYRWEIDENNRARLDETQQAAPPLSVGGVPTSPNAPE
jgi:competence protein ComGC